MDINFSRMWNGLLDQRARAFGFMILGALLAFEVFNFSTTEFALNDVLGNLKFAGMQWATILSIAFCGIDFAGIARIFTPEQGADEPAEVWYLFGAWILAAAMNATLTWWGVSVAIISHTSQGAAVIGGDTLQKAVPVFVAVMVWVIRILIIGTFSVAGEHLFSMSTARPRRTTAPVTPQPAPRENGYYRSGEYNNGYRSGNVPPRPQTASAHAAGGASGHTSGVNAYTAGATSSRATLTPASQLRQPAPRPVSRPEPTYPSRSEPTYHPLPAAREAYDE
ncbi:MAG: hypothetical protein CO094_10450 [Anaerolineae bacterium CG_4_9_14_3_um_filter_57_17]|nr:MAG: hypothetical protein AUK01_09450 [Anaerolineae bacterium CG2_30_57_67]PJB65224.1 MAG: hypothetical protein CO094_10450 [Anaerolineae bacterium CG_4_9_14_3_um_filter_57_17]